MSLAKQALKGGSWYALFTFTGQAFSWVVTFWLARLLMPQDYGLMALATIFTGYAAWFSELGLGAAIIQKENPTQQDLSSIFWFTVFIGIGLALACTPIAYASAYFFQETRLIGLTQAVAIIFLINGSQIVSSNLLRKRMEFKKLGLIKFAAVLSSCLYMLVSAYYGAGVWALLGGQIVVALVNAIFVITLAKWKPNKHYAFKEVRSYIHYGMKVAIGRTLFYITDNSDKFILGKKLGSVDVGFYSFALQLAQLPTEKITVIINQISFPFFSKLQHSKEDFLKYYLKIIKIISTLVMPLFVGGYLLGDELILIVLGEKWSPIILIFKYLCLAQIMTSLSATNNIVHNALGRAELSMYYNGICAFFMTVSFFIAAGYGVDAMIYPWCITYVLLSFGWIYFTIKKLGIAARQYIMNISAILISTGLMYISIESYKHYSFLFPWKENEMLAILLAKIVIGAVVYLSVIYIIDKELITDLRKIREAKQT